MEEVQRHLIRLTELARETAAALESRDEERVRKLDSEIETELGAKERSMGKLEAHREEHGC